jgi:uncharacterized protein (TIGR03382 family)
VSRSIVLALALCVTSTSASAVEFPVGAFASHWNKSGTQDPAVIDLASLGLNPGDHIRLTQVGGMRFSRSLPQNEGFLFGMFATSDTLLPNGGETQRVPDAVGVCATYNTAPISLPDVPQDFNISRVIFRTTPNNPASERYFSDVVIPQGATHLFVSAADNSYGDNIDQGLGIDISLAPDAEQTAGIRALDGTLVEGSQVGIDTTGDGQMEWYANDAPVPVQSDCSYDIALLPGINGGAQVPGLRFEGLFAEARWSPEQGNEIGGVWDTRQVTLRVTDNAGDEIAGSLLSLSGRAGRAEMDINGVSTGTVVALPTTDRDGAQGHWTTDLLGYDLHVFPGIGGDAQRGIISGNGAAQALYRTEGSHILDTSGSASVSGMTEELTFAWPVGPVRLHLRDQAGVDIPGSVLNAIDNGPWALAAPASLRDLDLPATVDLPANDIAGALGGWSASQGGFNLALSPGINDARQGGRLSGNGDGEVLYRLDGMGTEGSAPIIIDATVLADGSFDMTWEVADLTLHVRDQDGVDVRGSVVRQLGGSSGRIITAHGLDRAVVPGAVIRLPRNDSATALGGWSESRGGYDFAVVPGVNGAQQVGNLAGQGDDTLVFRQDGNNAIDGSPSVLVGASEVDSGDLSFVWAMAQVQLEAVDQDDAPVPGSLLTLTGNDTNTPADASMGLLRQELPQFIRLPVNTYSWAEGGWSHARGGYDLMMQPSYRGQPQSGGLHGQAANTSVFQHDGNEGGSSAPRIVSADTTRISLVWPQHACAFSVVGPDGPVSGATAVLPAELEGEGRIPSTDSGYGSASLGGYAEGYPLTVTLPGGSAQTVSVGLNAAGEPVPASFAMDGTDYAVSCRTFSPPTCTGGSAQVRLGQSVALDVSVDDANDDNWSLAFTPEGTGAQVDANAGQGSVDTLFRWTPDSVGQREFALIVTDETGQSGSCTVVVSTVRAAGLTIDGGIDGVRELAEVGPGQTLSVGLTTPPTDIVTIPLTVSDNTEGSVTVTELVFTPQSFAAQRLTIAGENDDLQDGDIDWRLTLGSPVSNDTDFAALPATDLAMRTVDDDVASVLVTPTVLSVFESGTEATYTVSLTAEPSATVVITPQGSNNSEGRAGNPMVFTTDAWQTPQTGTVIGVDDLLDDGDITWRVSHTVTSTDAVYSDLAADSVSVTTVDDDVSELAGLPIGGVVTSETGTTDTVSFSLTAEPTSLVTVVVSSSDTREATVSPASLLFDATNWQNPQDITVEGVDDELADGPVDYQVVLSPMSDDPGYGSAPATVIQGTNADDDTPGVGLDPVIDLVTSESGDAATFEVWLLSQPAADVTVTFESDSPQEGELDVAELVFTAEDWAERQTVTVLGVDDDQVDGDVDYEVFVAEMVSDGVDYDDLVVDESVQLTNLDDDGDAMDTGQDQPDDQDDPMVVQRSCGCSGVPVTPLYGWLFLSLGALFVRRRSTQNA